MTEIVLYCLIPVVAFLYAAVGHGGASGYLALMALFSLPPDLMRPTALLLNLFVVAYLSAQYLLDEFHGLVHHDTSRIMRRQFS